MKREAGVIPARSRHCKGEARHKRSLDNMSGKTCRAGEPEPGDLPVPKTGPTYVDRGWLICHGVIALREADPPSERVEDF